MAVRIPFGIDPAERWDIDYCAENARSQVELQRAMVKGLEEAAAAEKDQDKALALTVEAEKHRRLLAEAETDQVSYVPESGPVFTVTAIPATRRAELGGRHAEIEAMPEGKVQALARAEWSEDVLRLGIRGHRNLKTRSGRDLPYAADDKGGPNDATLAAYGAILVDLAWKVLEAQRLGAAGKNA